MLRRSLGAPAAYVFALCRGRARDGLAPPLLSSTL